MIAHIDMLDYCHSTPSIGLTSPSDGSTSGTINPVTSDTGVGGHSVRWSEVTSSTIVRYV